MTIACGKDDGGRSWTALYCNGCRTSIGAEKLDAETLRAEHGWDGDYCPDCQRAGRARAAGIRSGVSKVA